MPFTLILLARTQSYDHNLMSREIGEWDVPVCPRRGNVIGRYLASSYTNGDEFKSMKKKVEGPRDIQNGKMVAVLKYMKRST